MKTSIQSSRKSALLAAWSLILMAVMAGFAFGYLRNLTYSASEPMEAWARLQREPFWMTMEVGTWLTILGLDLLVSWAFWRLFKNPQPGRAFAVLALRVLYSLVLGLAIGQLFPLLNGAPGLSAEESVHLRAAFDRIWSYGLILFGLHLIVLGQAVHKDPRIPQLWAYLLYLAGGSYSLVHSLKRYSSLDADYLQYLESILALPMTVGELGFAVWLLWAGCRRKI
jgi:hypothetical protein